MATGPFAVASLKFLVHMVDRNRMGQRGYSLYRGTHFKDNEGFEANWMQCEAF